MAFSPNYANDRTLYATGNRGEGWGEGVWRSTDGGDTWSALWNNLVHRRGLEFIFDADFPQSRTLVLRAAFNDLANNVSGESYQQSTDGGLSWTVVATGNYSTAAGTVPLPPVGELLPAGPPPALSARIADYGHAIEATLDGSTWQTATTKLRDGDRFLQLLPSPDYPADATLYAFTEYSILRSSDGGASWATWIDPRLEKMDFNNSMRSFAVSPRLGDGGHRLVVGTADGQVWLIDPGTAAWAAIEAAPAPAAARAPAATAAPAPASPLALPTATPVAAALAGEPPAGLFRPQGSFAPMWEGGPKLQQDLGWAKAQEPAASSAAVETFENGRMVWLQSADAIYVLYNNGAWQRFPDTFEEGQPEKDLPLCRRGASSSRSAALAKSGAPMQRCATASAGLWAGRNRATAQVQPFERGLLLRLGGTVWTLLGDDKGGQWY